MYACKTILQRAESTRIRWILLPSPDLAPETEPPQPPLKLKDIQISTMSHKDSVDSQPILWTYNIGIQSRQKNLIYKLTYTNANIQQMCRNRTKLSNRSYEARSKKL